MYVYKKISFCHPTQVALTTKFSGFGAKKLGSHTTNHRKWATHHVHPV